MQRYMERKLTNLHETSQSNKFKENFKIFCAGLIVAVLLPIIHIGVYYYIWTPDKPAVDRGKCTCACFDTVFRGRYEWPPAGYKHVYFNCTSNTVKIWILIVVGILAVYESVRYVCRLFLQRQLRVPMFILLLSSFYPHYYGWWGFFGYWNDDFYVQFYHQLFFTITEILSTLLVLHLCNQMNAIQPWKFLAIITINTMHILVNCLDQFVSNVIYRQSKGFEAFRDIALMMPDIFHVMLPFFELHAYAAKRRTSILDLFYKEEIMASCLVLILFSLLGKNM